MPNQSTYRNIAVSLFLALQYEPFYIELARSVSDDPAKKREALIMYLDYSMVESQKYGELVIPDGGTYGASIWSKPTDEVITQKIYHEKSDFIRYNFGEASLKTYIDIIENMEEKVKAIIPAQSWYLSILGISPAMQGKGLGGALVKPVLDKTDTLGVPSYLETFNPRNRSFYQWLGYNEIASFIEPLTACEYWIMLREPMPGRH